MHLGDAYTVHQQKQSMALAVVTCTTHHCLHTHAACTLTPPAHSHCPHTHTARTPTLPAHPHCPHTHAARTLTLPAHSHCLQSCWREQSLPPLPAHRPGTATESSSDPHSENTPFCTHQKNSVVQCICTYIHVHVQ